MTDSESSIESDASEELLPNKRNPKLPLRFRDNVNSSKELIEIKDSELHIMLVNYIVII